MNNNKEKIEDIQFDAIVVGKGFLVAGQQKNFVNKA